MISSVAAQDTANVESNSYEPLEISIGESRTMLITGFGDFLATFDSEDNSEIFAVNQAEIGFESDLTDKFAVALAVAYVEESFTIGTFTADYSGKLGDRQLADPDPGADLLRCPPRIPSSA